MKKTNFEHLAHGSLCIVTDDKQIDEFLFVCVTYTPNKIIATGNSEVKFSGTSVKQFISNHSQYKILR